MPVDTSVILGYKPVELQNPLAAYGQIAQLQNAQNQNALAQYQLSSARRADENANALSKAYSDSLDPATGEIDRNKLVRMLATGGQGSQVPGLMKNFQEIDKSRTENAKLQTELVDKKLKLSREGLSGVADPQGFQSWFIANATDPVLGPHLKAMGITPDKVQAQIAQAMQTPNGFTNMVNEWKMGVDKFAEQNKPHFMQQNLGDKAQIISVPGMGGAPSVVGSSQINMTPNEAAMFPVHLRQVAATERNANTSAGQLTVAQQNLQFQKDKDTREQANPKPVWNEAGQAWVTPPTAVAPESKVTAVPELAQKKAVKSAQDVLRTAGYDPKTGTDDVSKLIAKSTGGVLQRGGAEVLGAFNIGTSGQQAIGQLKTRANAITLDLMNGKLGAGISNDDRNFMTSKLGDVANDLLPASTRLASWKDFIGRTKSLAGGSSGASGSFGDASPNTPVKITDDSAYNKLPSGAEFIAPDGSHRRKP